MKALIGFISLGCVGALITPSAYPRAFTRAPTQLGLRHGAAKVQPAQRRAKTVLSAETFKVGIVGATGAVGEEIIGVLKKRGFPIESIHAFASERSAGKIVATEGFGDIVCEAFTLEGARSMDVVFLAVDGAFAKEWAEKITEGDGPFVIDNSSEFRRDPRIPLVIPEINGHLAKTSKLLANPNCTTAIALMALYPLLKKYGMKRMIMSTYQAASGAGAPGMNELKDGVMAYAKGEEPTNDIFAYPLPFNLIPQIDVFQENGYTKEEMKVAWETQKIFDMPDLPVSCTAVRIPTFRAHAETITIETERPCPPDEAREILKAAPGVTLKDDPANKIYPMPITATGQYDIEVGRIRQSLVFGDCGLDLFVCGDQLLRGAALNAVLVAEAALL